MSSKECKLQMLDLYFSKFTFSQSRSGGGTEYTSSFNIEYAVNNQDNSKIKVTINTSVQSKSEDIILTLETIGLFQIEDADEETYNHLVKANTVAIMFPYIRSQVSLLTTQPGIQPVMIPPMNIGALVMDEKDKE